MPVPSTPPPFFGTRVVRAAFVLAVLGWGVGFYGPQIWLQAVLARTGWTLPLVSAAVTLHFLAGVPVVAMLPRLHARFGVPGTIVAGATITAAGVFGWAIAVQPWQLFVAALLSGIGWVALGAVAVNAVVSPWHVRTRPAALAKAYNGASLGGVLFSPLWVALIAALGFARAALLVGAVMVLVLAGLARRVFAWMPAHLGQAPDGDAAAAPAPQKLAPHTPLPGARLWRTPAFVRLALGMAAGLFAQIGLLAHLFALLVPAFGAQFAGVLMGGATGCAIVGRGVAARLTMHVHDRRRVAAAGYVVQALGSLVLLAADAGRPGWIVLGIVLFGSGIGNATSLPPLIAQSDFSSQDVPRVVALIVAFAQACYAFAPALFGLLLAASGAGAAIGKHTAALFAAAAAVQLFAAMAIVGRS